MKQASLRAAFSALLLLTLVTAACTGSGHSTTTGSSVTSVAPATTEAAATTPPTTTLPPDPRMLEEVPVDPDVIIGELANGFDYYVRENFRPGGRAQLRLVVDAGSVLEDEDQSGAAHFVEHMLFNGTERFPENELTRVLESFGARFGPDVNAYTSFDETVYELALPTDDPAHLELGFDVLYEWAAKATIDQADVEAERGVVLEEWRLRDAGVDGRISKVYEDLFLEGTGYEGRAPIGDPAVLRTTDAAALRRFYDEWYRPDLMAVVAVGDFDGDEVVAMIEARFSQMAASSGARPRPEIAVPAFKNLRLGVLADQDQPTASVELYYPGPVNQGTTIGDARSAWARLLATDMIATRLNDDVTRGIAPYFSVDAIDFNFTRRLALPGLGADVAPGDIMDALVGMVVEVERVRRHGFNAAEYDRALLGWQASVEQYYAGRASTQDVEYADRYVTHFLAGGTIPSAPDQYDIDLELLAAITPAEAARALTDLVESSDLAAVVIGPDDGTVPDEATMASAIEVAIDSAIEPRPADAAVGTTLLIAPDPVEPVAVNQLPLGVTELVYANGARVQFVQSDISVNQVVMGASSPGGLSRLADEDVAEGALIAYIDNRSWAGGFDRVALETFMADQFVGLFPYIDVTREGFFGSAATEDLETLLALIHLNIVSPRADDAAAATVIGEIRPYVESPEDIPGLATTLELVRRRWGDEPRYQVIPTVADLEAFDLDAARGVFLERFGDAGDFVFAFAGDFTSAGFRRLADTYIGTLPGSDRDDSWLDFQQDPPRGVIDETIAVGNSEQGFVTLLFTEDFNRDAVTDVQVELLTLIADVKLRDRIREALSATYSPFVSTGAVDEPDALIETYLQVSGDPDRLDEIVAESLATLRGLATDGPSEEELATAKEQLARRYELISNEWWVDQMLFFATHPNETLNVVFERAGIIEATTQDDIRRLAAAAFPADSYVLIRQIPA